MVVLPDCLSWEVALTLVTGMENVFLNASCLDLSKKISKNSWIQFFLADIGDSIQ